MTIIRIYSGQPSYKRVLLRSTSWWMCHWRNAQVSFIPNWRSVRFWHWNIQLLIAGTTKCNGSLKVRLLNWELEMGW